MLHDLLCPVPETGHTEDRGAREATPRGSQGRATKSSQSVRRASQHPRAGEREAQQGWHLPALPSKGGNPHPTSAWAPPSPGQGQSAPAAPRALSAARLSSSSMDALGLAGRW